LAVTVRVKTGKQMIDPRCLPQFRERDKLLRRKDIIAVSIRFRKEGSAFCFDFCLRRRLTLGRDDSREPSAHY
jgi:hypothetical protein